MLRFPAVCQKQIKKIRKENRAMKEKINESWCKAIQKLKKKKCHCFFCPAKELCDIAGQKNEVGVSITPDFVTVTNDPQTCIKSSFIL